jgi:pimeloyl-ACP methyl ester carboxylesterase
LPTVLRGAAASDLPSEQQLQSLAMPALILAWDTDSGHPRSTAERLAALLPSALLEIASRADEIPRWPIRVRDFLASIG